MRSNFLIVLLVGVSLSGTSPIFADEPVKPSVYAQPKAAMPGKGTVSSPGKSSTVTVPVNEAAAPSADYKIGNEDVLDINVLQPEKIAMTVTVSPDGSITFPYIGKVVVKGKTPAQVQEDIQQRLTDGYLKYPVVSVSVKESRSKKFYVYGEVARPGTYFLEDNMTVLKAISTAGGFTKYGSSSRVKVLRPKIKGAGYDMIKVNMKLIMNGVAQDTLLEPGDIVQVEEGVF